MPDDQRYCGRCACPCSRQSPCRCCEFGLGSRHDLPEDVLRAYDHRFPKARETRLADPLAAYGWTLTKHLLTVADAAMQDEGVDPRTRHRVLSTLVYGASSPADAQERMLRQDQQVELAKRMAARVPPRLDLPPFTGGRVADFVAFEPSALAAAAAKGHEVVSLTLPVPAPCAIELSSGTPHWERVWAYDCVGDGPYTARLGTADATQPDGILHLKLGSPHAAGAVVKVVPHV